MDAGARPSRSSRRYMSEINVTPLVDVILVLLIIFMVTAPMMTKGLDVKLPDVTARPIAQKQQTIRITVVRGGDVYLNKVKVDGEVLKKRLFEMKREGSIEQVLLFADRSVPYGRVAQVVASVREAGIQDLGLVTRPMDVPSPTGKDRRNRDASPGGVSPKRR